MAPATGGGPAGPTRQEAPSELNVGDEGEALHRWCCLKPYQLDFSFLNFQFLCFPPDPSGRRLHPTSPLDPLLAGLLSVFIVTTAFVFIVLFLKFRQRTNHPEFHRLQDLPMVRRPSLSLQSVSQSSLYVVRSEGFLYVCHQKPICKRDNSSFFNCNVRRDSTKWPLYSPTKSISNCKKIKQCLRCHSKVTISCANVLFRMT